MLRYLTAGESHGKCLVAILEGLPAGLPLEPERVNQELRRRQHGYGRGGRMLIEQDTVQIVSGMRRGKTMGSPIALEIQNRDFSIDALPVVTRPRPGHADLTGALKYDQDDIRTILERASARETAARVAVGAVCRVFVEQFGMDLLSHVVRLGGIDAAPTKTLSVEALRRQVEGTPLRCADAKAQKKMMALIDAVKQRGDTVGGTIEVLVTGAPVGLGSHVHYDRKLDARIAGALMSIQAIKAVELGDGVRVSQVRGSELHDEIYYGKDKGFYRKTDRGGGFEGGMTTGAPIVFRVHMKPLSTLRRPLKSVDLKTKQPFVATVERSDVSAVPAAGVIAEAVVAFELANAVLEKFGGDSLGEIQRNWRGYLQQLRRF
ncbi:MAG: chorismate synthase [Omnitrophica WOR_2 bacterium RIFCSPHIGHO2_02_FULL_68_15]|nr:MAG: chorismate synthase [Omnitrophica WOR_2 bacterium RIFCSPHIGHO2_02_FULL_68_15]